MISVKEKGTLLFIIDSDNWKNRFLPNAANPL